MTMMSSDIYWQTAKISPSQRALQKKQTPFVLWFTGLSGSGKSTLAQAVDTKLFERGKHCIVLDGDNLRHGLNNNLSFAQLDRTENSRRIAEVAKLMNEAGIIALVASISPFSDDRAAIKKIIGVDKIIEVYISTPLSICEQRDVKGLYKQARQGLLTGFTGIDSPYQIPTSADIELDTSCYPLNECVNHIMNMLMEQGKL